MLVDLVVLIGLVVIFQLWGISSKLDGMRALVTDLKEVRQQLRGWDMEATATDITEGIEQILDPIGETLSSIEVDTRD